MNKKELRKELELTLVKTIEDVLNKHNAKSAKKVRRTTFEVSKIVAKKFYKSLKQETKIVSKKTAPVKKFPTKNTTAAVKAPALKTKAKSKK
jgi:hypothetical protein